MGYLFDFYHFNLENIYFFLFAIIKLILLEKSKGLLLWHLKEQ